MDENCFLKRMNSEWKLVVFLVFFFFCVEEGGFNDIEVKIC